MSAIGIYGAGGYGRTLLHAIREHGDEPAFFIDQYCRDREVEGLPVLRINEVTDRATRILVSVGLVPLASDPSTDIVGTLSSAGFSDVVSFADSLQAYPKVVPGIIALEHLWMRSTPSEMLDEDKLARVSMLLSDTKSKELLQSIVEFRRTPAALNYVPPDGQLEYFPDDIDVFAGMDAVRFLDCGAYVGDTIAELNLVLENKQLPLEYAASFEPDPKNFEKLTAELSKQQSAHPSSRFFACRQGVWSENTVLTFNADSSSSANLVTSASANDSDTSVQVVCLDDMFGAASPNFIKMDIEGAEREALLGARQLISETRPVLAICVYHKPEDLWDLPLLIAEMNPSYDMYLRVHSHMGLSTVLYCVPR